MHSQPIESSPKWASFYTLRQTRIFLQTSSSFLPLCIFLLSSFLAGKIMHSLLEVGSAHVSRQTPTEHKTECQRCSSRGMKSCARAANALPSPVYDVWGMSAAGPFVRFGQPREPQRVLGARAWRTKPGHKRQGTGGKGGYASTYPSGEGSLYLSWQRNCKPLAGQLRWQELSAMELERNCSHTSINGKSMTSHCMHPAEKLSHDTATVLREGGRTVQSLLPITAIFTHSTLALHCALPY